jgi:uncharacterized membrane protein YcjF (UPF0283 family)
MNPAFKRMFWRAILGGLIVLGASFGVLQTIDTHDFWARQGWIALMGLGTLLAVSGAWPYWTASKDKPRQGK